MKKIFTLFAVAMMALTATAAETITVAQAIEETKKLGEGNTSTETYTVIGYVAKFYQNSSAVKNGAQSFYMSDVKDNDPTRKDYEFEAFKAKVSEAVHLADKVTVTGKLTYYKSNKGVVTYEIKDGTCTLVEPSGIEEIAKSEDIKKAMVDGQVVIVNDGKCYNLQGQEIK